MVEILEARVLNPQITLLKLKAERIAKKVQPGQFVILHQDEKAERIPLTIADSDPQEGTITVIVQAAGESTKRLCALKTGDSIRDVVGPLGQATDFGEAQNICVIGGGVGCAIAYPSAKACHQRGAHVDLIAGFKNESLVILKEEMAAIADEFTLISDDGSTGKQGFVTDALKEKLEQGKKYDLVIAIGPIIMMKMVCKVTEAAGIKTLVSLNPIMIDGTGMCGCCRVTVGGEVKFACVDGPDFDGHQVDFDEVIARNATYREFEARRKQDHLCRLGGGAMNG